MSQVDPVTLLINGMRYGGWTTVTIETGVDRAVSSFNLEVTERWTGQATPWRINPYDFVQVYIGPDLIVTGYVEALDPGFDAKSHHVKITGHSKTKQLVDCTPDIPSGQFSGFTVAAIARAISAIFKIDAVVQTDLANVVVQNTNLQRCETAFSFLERLGRLAGVLLCDDENGNLVLTIAGSTKASSRLTQGENIKAASASINVSKRFSHYIIKGQAGVGYGGLNLNGAGGRAAAPTGTVQTRLRAVAIDPFVPLYRPRVVLAESQMTLAQMQQRANWMMQYAYGQSLKAPITVQGFRQSDGTLWRKNQIVSAKSLFLGIDADLLVARVKYFLDATSSGHSTTLELGPVEGYTPDPGEVKLHKTKGRKGGGLNLSGAGGFRNVRGDGSGPSRPGHARQGSAGDDWRPDVPAGHRPRRCRAR